MPTKRKPTRAKQLGVTSEQYEAMLQAQGGGCAICGNPPKTRRLDVDHDHKTGKVRGLLCHRDNRALPTWMNPERLDSAYRYLVRHELRDTGRLRYAVEGDCWVWQRALSDKGYPVIRYSGQTLYVHRLMYHGVIPADNHVHHTCEQRACINPSHLEVLTPVAHTRYHHHKARTCKRGHPWTPENTYLRPGNGRRMCLACIRIRTATAR